MNYELFRHNFDCLRNVSWGSENTTGDDVMFELMDTAATIAVANVRLPVLKRGVRTHHLSLKNLSENWKLDLSDPFWSEYVELIDAVIPNHPKGGRFVMIATERGDVHWTTYGF